LPACPLVAEASLALTLSRRGTGADAGVAWGCARRDDAGGSDAGGIDEPSSRRQNSLQS
jgi:hypothetical protein